MQLSTELERALKLSFDQQRALGKPISGPLLQEKANSFHGKLFLDREYNRETSKVCNEIIKTGTFGSALNKTSIQTYLLDLFEIGASKYTLLKKLLKQENIIFPSYKIISQFRQEISPHGVVLHIILPLKLTLYQLLHYMAISVCSGGIWYSFIIWMQVVLSGHLQALRYRIR